MKNILWTILLGCAATLHAETNASMLYDGDVNALLVDKDTFYVKVVDEVTGGCLPKPDQLKQSMEASTEQHPVFDIYLTENPHIRRDPLVSFVTERVTNRNSFQKTQLLNHIYLLF